MESYWNMYWKCMLTWGDGSGVKRTCCSCGGPGFDSQHSHSSLQPSITAVPGKLTSCHICVPFVHVGCFYTPRLNTHKHKTNKYFFKNICMSSHTHKVNNIQAPWSLGITSRANLVSRRKYTIIASILCLCVKISRIICVTDRASVKRCQQY